MKYAYIAVRSGPVQALTASRLIEPISLQIGWHGAPEMVAALAIRGSGQLLFAPERPLLCGPALYLVAAADGITTLSFERATQVLAELERASGPRPAYLRANLNLVREARRSGLALPVLSVHRGRADRTPVYARRVEVRAGAEQTWFLLSVPSSPLKCGAKCYGVVPPAIPVVAIDGTPYRDIPQRNAKEANNG